MCLGLVFLGCSMHGDFDFLVGLLILVERFLNND